MIHLAKAKLLPVSASRYWWGQINDALMDALDRGDVETAKFILTKGIIMGGANNIADYLEGKIIDHVFRNTAIFTPPANIYVALFTADPTDTGSNANEVANLYTYARQAVNTTTGWSGAAASSATDNVAAIDFGTATGGAWGTITHGALTNSATQGAGNHYFNGALTASKSVVDGDGFKFAIGDLDVSVS